MINFTEEKNMNDKIKAHYENELNEKISEIRRHSESLCRTLTSLIERIKEEGSDAFINTRGECQSQARTIDDLCKEVALIRIFLSFVEEEKQKNS